MFQFFRCPAHRQLVLYKAYADLRAEAERTYIGYFWWFLEPVVHMVVYYIVIGVFLQRGTENFVPFLLTGLVAFRWFSMSLTSGMNSIMRAKGLMNQVAVDKSIFPTVALLTNAFKFAIVYVVLIAFLLIYGYPVTASFAHIPAVLLVQLVFNAALAYLLAAVTPFVPDIRIVVQNAMRALFFFSGIFYSASSLPEEMRFYFFLNPVAVLLQAHRDVLLYAQTPDWERLVAVALGSIPILVLGELLIARKQDIYPKVVH